jgi:hypothetical protein
VANGFCPSLLYHINQIAGDNAPGRKMHVAGFLAMLFCCQNSNASLLNSAYDGGHSRPLAVKYTRRPLVSDVQDEDNCDINAQPTYEEWNIPGLLHRQYSVFLPDDLIRQYCVDASQMRSVGQPPTQVMQEVYDRIVEGANVVLAAVNQSLVTLQATEFGVNVTTGSDTGKLINISRNGTDFSLDNGVVEMMQDIQENEICGDICIVGGGIFSAFTKAQALACCNAAGMDLSRATFNNFYFDKDTQTIWGQNTIGAFAKGSVKFLSRNRYIGPWAGQRGNSYFATMPLPVEEFGCADECLRDLRFDIQVKYNDCPVDDGNGGTLPRGTQVIISKDYSLWTQPTNAFSDGDPLEGTNGTLKYFVSNTSYNGPAYGPYSGF